MTPHSETTHRVSLSASIRPGASDGVARVGPQPYMRPLRRFRGIAPEKWASRTVARSGILGGRSCLVAQRLPIPLRIVCCPYMDSAIWNAVNQPFETQPRPPGSVPEGWVTFAGPEGGSPKLVNDRSRSAICRAEWPVL